MKFLSKILNVISPPTCYVCKSILQDSEGICQKCFSKLFFIKDPMCEICGTPFEFELEENLKGFGKGDNRLVCPGCIANMKKIHFDNARSVFKYTYVSKKILMRFKHGDAINLANFISKCIDGQLHNEIKKYDLIIPVPLHFKRMFVRKYNQSFLIAKQLSEKTGLSVCGNILKRKVFKKSQGKMTRSQREQNIKGNFSIDKKFCGNIKDKKVILIDDVMTTGATVNQCAKELKKAGAREVFVITFCKVCRVI